MNSFREHHINQAPSPLVQHRPTPNKTKRTSLPRWRQFSNWLVFLAATLALTLSSSAAQRQILRRQIPEAVAHLTPISRLAETNSLKVAIGLPLRNQAALSNLLQQVSHPASPNFRKYLKPAQFTQQFGPSEADYQKVIAFAKANGLEIGTHPNRMLVDVKGSVDKIEKAFGVKMHVYKHPKEDRYFYAPDKEPSMGLDVPVLGVSGLNNYSRPLPRVKTSALTNSAALPQFGTGPDGTYMGNDFRAAYVPGSALTGAGQSVGLVQFDGYDPADITYYENLAGLSHVPLTNVLLDGFDGLPTGSGGEVEVCLDIQMVISMAPQLSKVILYMAGPYGNWYDILNCIANDTDGNGNPAAYQLSCSWYSPDAPADPVADQILMQMAVQGQSFFNASGDYCAFYKPVDFPGDTPYLTQVGGTTLSTDIGGGEWTSETTWNWYNDIGTGGGISTYYTIPSWQAGVDMSTNQGSTTMRNIPDVALTADNIYVRANGQNYASGGTSAAAPLWAGFAALVNQQAGLFGTPPLGFANPVLYDVGATNLSCFHDITTGDNTSYDSPDRYYAMPGYDLCTGWGTPAGTALINVLAPGAVTAPPTILAQPESKTVTEGHSTSLSIGAVGATPITYQWKHNGTAIPGATNTVLNFNNSVLTDAGTYTVDLSNAYGTATSDAGVLTVNSAVCIAGSANIVSWWKAENNASDTMGLNAGVLQGGVSYGTGLAGQYGFSFDGTGCVHVPASTSLDIGAVPSGAQGGAFTLEAWVNPSGPGTVFAWTNTATGSYTRMSIRENGVLFGGFLFGLGQWDHTTQSGLIKWNRYQHIAMVFDDSTRQGKTRFFVNGVEVYYTGYDHTWNTNIVNVGTQGDMHLGDAFTGDNFTGRIDEPAIYNRALSATEIAAIYQAGAAGRCATANAPAITAQPQSQTIVRGHNGVFTVAADGSDTGSLSYQWRCNGVAIPGATQTNYSVVNASSTATYSVVVANRIGAVTSTDAVLTVNQPLSVPSANGLVSWWQAEDNGEDVMGLNRAIPVSNVYYVPGFIGNAFYFEYWSGLDGWADAWVAESPSLNVGQNGEFTVEAWINMQEFNPGLAPCLIPFEWSGAASLQILDGGRLYGFVPLSTNTYYIDCASARGVINWNTYQHIAMTFDYNEAQSNAWLRIYVNGIEVGSKFMQGLGSSYQVVPGTTGDLYLGQYCRGIIDEPAIYNRCLSDTEILGIYDASVAGRSPQAPLSVAVQPASQTVIEGQFVQFTNVITGYPTHPLNYQWLYNGANIPDATNSFYSPGNVVLASAGSYSVMVSNAAGSAVSPNATLSVNAASPSTAPSGLVSWWQAEGNTSDAMGLNPGVIEGSVSYETGFAGQAFTFNGTGNLRVPASTSLNIGAGGAFTIEGWVKSPGDGGGFILLWPGDSGLEDVVVASMENKIQGWIEVTPGQMGDSIWFEGRNPLPSNYQHFAVTYSDTNRHAVVRVYVNGVLAGETTRDHPGQAWTPQTFGDLSIGKYYEGQVDELSLYNRTLSEAEIAGIYNSSVAGKNPPAPCILTQPQSQAAILGQNVSFSVTVAGAPPITYQWKFNGANIAGATTSCLTINNVQSSNAGSYSVAITNAVGSTNSSTAILTVNSPPSLSLGIASITEQVISFETITDYTNDHVLFRAPLNSSTTSSFVDNKKTNSTLVVTNFPAGNPNGSGSKVLKADWTFKTGTSNPWLRLTTLNPVRIPNPAFNFASRIRFDLYSTRSIKLAMGMRETGSNVPIGANGGTNGAIEWVGVTGKTGTAPNCTRTIPAGTWTNIAFDLSTEPCLSFTNGNGVLTGAQGVLEHLAIVPNAGITNYTIYVDNFQVITNATLPTQAVRMNHNASLAFTASAADPDAGQTLTYSLDAGAPSGAAINAGTGVFTWIPSAGQTNQTYNITVRATDNGNPSLSDTKNAIVTVVADPLGTMSAESSTAETSAGTLLLSWPAIPGSMYQVQYRQGVDGEWTNLGSPIIASGAETSFEVSGSDRETDYRILDLGGPVSEQ